MEFSSPSENHDTQCACGGFLWRKYSDVVIKAILHNCLGTQWYQRKRGGWWSGGDP